MKYGTAYRWLIAFALLMRVLVPSGFMLDAAQAAPPTLIACDGQGPAFAAPAYHHHGARHDHHGADQMHGDCPFSGGAVATDTAPSPIVALVPERNAAPLVSPAERLAYRPAPAALSPPSTGPPIG